MRIGIDVRYLSHGLVGGVHTYIKHFVAELCTIAADHEIVLYADTKCPFELNDLPPSCNAAIAAVPGSAIERVSGLHWSAARNGARPSRCGALSGKLRFSRSRRAGGGDAPRRADDHAAPGDIIQFRFAAHTPFNGDDGLSVCRFAVDAA